MAYIIGYVVEIHCLANIVGIMCTKKQFQVDLPYVFWQNWLELQFLSKSVLKSIPT